MCEAEEHRVPFPYSETSISLEESQSIRCVKLKSTGCHELDELPCMETSVYLDEFHSIG